MYLIPVLQEDGRVFDSLSMAYSRICKARVFGCRYCVFGSNTYKNLHTTLHSVLRVVFGSTVCSKPFQSFIPSSALFLFRQQQQQQQQHAHVVLRSCGGGNRCYSVSHIQRLPPET